MNKHIKSMIEKRILFGGKISNVDDFLIFTRLPIEELEKINETEIAFATGSMGRAIFQMNEDGSIKNIKGVDSHLENDEIITKQLAGADASSALNPIAREGSYREITYPINLVKFVDGSLDVRIRGASPLEDLEEEAEKNRKMQGAGIKLPQIDCVREMPVEVCEQLGLPIKVEGSYDDFVNVSYRCMNDQRKAFLHETLGEDYLEDLPSGLRAESLREYFIRTGLMELEEFRTFAEQRRQTVSDFVQAVDDNYELGQRYGQTLRKMESPFRISDLEYYVKNGNIEAVEEIVAFSDELFGKGMPFETVFAKQMGKNVAFMMNSGWKYNNFMHRQDFSLAGEMCDDAYDNVKEHLEHLDKNSDKGKTITEFERRQYYLQIYTIASTIKILQDEMELRGKSKDERDELLQDFVKTFSQHIDFPKVGEIFGDTKEQVEKFFSMLTAEGNNYSYAMAEEFPKPDKPKEYNKQVLQGHQGFSEFYEIFSRKLAEKLHIERIKAGEKLTFESGIEETKITENDRNEENNIISLFKKGELLARGMESSNLNREYRTGKIYYDYSGVSGEINEAMVNGKDTASTSLLISGNRMNTYKANGFLIDSNKTDIVHISLTDSGSSGGGNDFYASGESLSSLQELVETSNSGNYNPMNEINVNMGVEAYRGIFTSTSKYNVAQGIIMQKIAERMLQRKLPIFQYDNMRGKLTNLQLSKEEKISIIKQCIEDQKLRTNEIQYEIDGQMFSFDILEELEKENSQSILDSAKEAIEADGTRIGKVNKEASIIKAKEHDRMNSNIEKEGNDLGLDDE